MQRPPSSGPTKRGSYNFSRLTKEEFERLESEALAAIHQVKKRSFRLVGFKDPNNPRLSIQGCGGNGGEYQKAVAQRMNDVAIAFPDLAPELLIFTGDMNYDYGLKSPLDPDLNTNFHQPYGNEELPGIYYTPAYAAAGNHDVNVSSKTNLKSKLSLNFRPTGRRALENLVAATYTPDGKRYTQVSELVNIHNQDEIHLSALNQFNMPRDYFDLRIGNKRLLFPNSNTLGQDYINYLDYIYEGNRFACWENQIIWLKNTLAEARALDEEILIIQHHGLRSFNKRDIPSHYDTHHYLTLALIEKFKSSPNDEIGHHEIIYSLYQDLGLLKRKEGQKRVTFYVAHAHCLTIFEHEDFFQLEIGTAGGDLQEWMSLRSYPDLKTYIMRHGFAIAYNDLLHIFTTSKDYLIPSSNSAFNVQYQLVYDTKQQKFICNNHPDERVNKLRNLVRLCCDKFLLELKDAQVKAFAAEKELIGAKRQAESKMSYKQYLFHKASSIYPTPTPIQTCAQKKRNVDHSQYTAISSGGLWSKTKKLASTIATSTINLVKSYFYDAAAYERFCVADTHVYFSQVNLSSYKNCLAYLLELEQALVIVEKLRGDESNENLFIDILFTAFKQEFGNEVAKEFENADRPKPSLVLMAP